MKIMDCTLRDGANVLGNGFPKELTEMMLRGLVNNGVSIIEYGNAKGIGAYEVSGAVAPLTDDEYLKLASPFIGQAEIGMFYNAKRFLPDSAKKAADHGLAFLRVGADAGDYKISERVIRSVKDSGIKSFYSLMKAYLSTPEELVEEAEILENMGVDEITIMDSAGFMQPEQAGEYVAAMKEKVHIPVGFHGHNNLGLALANALAANDAGADIIDCGLLGMARSAGNIPTELVVAALGQRGTVTEVDFYGLLNFLDRELIPEMAKHGYKAAITPLELVLGYSGCHSSFLKTFKKTAEEYQVDLFRLICEVSALNKKNPDAELIEKIASGLQKMEE